MRLDVASTMISSELFNQRLFICTIGMLNINPTENYVTTCIPTVIWHCWLADRKGVNFVENPVPTTAKSSVSILRDPEQVWINRPVKNWEYSFTTSVCVYLLQDSVLECVIQAHVKKQFIIVIRTQTVIMVTGWYSEGCSFKRCSSGKL